MLVGLYLKEVQEVWIQLEEQEVWVQLLQQEQEMMELLTDY